MTEEENKKLIHDLAESHDFIGALLCASKNISENQEDVIDIRQVGLFFYHAGYVACLEYLENKDKTRPFVNKEKLQ